MPARRRMGLTGALVCAAAGGCGSAPQRASGGGSTDRTVLSRALPPLDGARLRVTVVEVTYGPGGASPPHRHPCAVIGYVVDGTLRTRGEGGPDTTYRAGDSFYEPPNAVHLVSANGSDTQPVRFLAYFSCDHDTPLSVAAP